MVLEEKKPLVRDSKAADPGLAFVLYMNDGSAFNSTMSVTVTVTTPINTYTSVVSINQAVTDTEVTFIVPFGDANWNNEIGKSIAFSLSVHLPALSSTPFVLTGAVMADQGTFNYNTNLPRKVVENQNPPIATNGQFMIGSEDGDHVGVLTTDGNFSVYPQCVIDSGSIPATQSTKPKNDTSGPWSAVTLIVSNGYVYLMNGSIQLYRSNEQRTGGWLVISNGAMFLKDANGSTALTTPFTKLF